MLCKDCGEDDCRCDHLSIGVMQECVVGEVYTVCGALPIIHRVLDGTHSYYVRSHIGMMVRGSCMLDLEMNISLVFPQYRIHEYNHV